MSNSSSYSPRREEQQTFLLKLNEQLRGIADTDEVQAIAMRVLAEYLNVSRAQYFDVDVKNDVVTTVQGYSTHPVEMPNRFRNSDFGDHFPNEYKAGRTVKVNDAETAPFLSEGDRERLREIGSRAGIGVPLLKNDELIAVVAVHDSSPREWTPEEVSLVEAVAERTWAAVERAKAESALHRTEEQLRLALSKSKMGTFVWFVDEDRGEPDERMLELFGLPRDGELNLSSALASMIHPDDRERYAAEVAQATDPAGDGTLQSEIRVVHPDGSQHWIGMMARTVFEGHPLRATIMYGMAADVTERRRAEQRIRDREVQKAFLLQLSDTIRLLADAAAIEGEACRLLAEFLDVNRAYYVAVDEEAGLARVRNDFVRGGVAPLAGEHRVADFAWSVAILLRGEMQIVADTQNSPLVPESDRPAAASLGIIATLGAPLIKDGKLAGAICVTDAHPREWNESEVELLREAGDRVWAAIERAHAEEALRRSFAELKESRRAALNLIDDLIVAQRKIEESETKYRTLFESIDEGFCTIEVLFDDAGQAVDYVFLEANPAFVRQTGLENAIGKSVREFAPQHEAFWFETYGRIAKTGQAMRFEHEAAALTPVRFYDVYAFRIGEPGENKVAVLFNDILERRRAQGGLKESRETF